MLSHLAIRDVVLIDRVDLTLAPGLTALTGETGAGKSILLDSLGLVLGERASAGLVRAGAERLQVTAAFDLPPRHPAHDLIKEHDLPAEDTLILRRGVSADGRSKAAINDAPCSATLMRTVAATLVEIEGQFAAQGLLDPGNHRTLLDAFAAHDALLDACAKAHAALATAKRALTEAEATLAAARRDEATLRAHLDALDALDPQPGQEHELAARRETLMHGEKLSTAIGDALGALQQGDPARPLREALRHMDGLSTLLPGVAGPATEALDTALVQIAEAESVLERAGGDLELDPRALEHVEERLFALRAAARKHTVAVDDLAGLRADFAAQLEALDRGDQDLQALRKAAHAAAQTYHEAAHALSRSRTEAARRLDAAVARELPDLKLERASFATTVSPASDDEAAWSARGFDTVRFAVATNPGQKPGDLDRIASGGELARFMLAIKVALAERGGVPVLVFDEVDAGIGGATAAAVGARLAKLARHVQVLVVTHSPQVAARADHHLQVSKADADGTVRTAVTPLSGQDRVEEIARMLAGAAVTDEARAAARRLLDGEDAA